MRFLWPDLIWLLLLLPALAGAYVYALRRRKKDAIRFTNLGMVRAALGPGQKIRRHLPPALFLAALAAAIVAMARPTAIARPVIPPASPPPVMLAALVSAQSRRMSSNCPEDMSMRMDISILSYAHISTPSANT